MIHVTESAMKLYVPFHPELEKKTTTSITSIGPFLSSNKEPGNCSQSLKLCSYLVRIFAGPYRTAYQYKIVTDIAKQLLRRVLTTAM